MTERLCASVLAIMVATMLLQVFCRYVLNASLSWSEELTRLLFVWLTFLGFSLGVQREALPTMFVLGERVANRTAASVLLAARDMLSLAVAMLMAFSGFRLAPEIAAIPTPALGVSVAWFPLAVGCGGALLVVQLMAKAFARTGSRVVTSLLCAAGGLVVLGVAWLPPGVVPLEVAMAGVFLGFSVLGVPIALSLAGTAYIGLADYGFANLEAIARELAEGVNSFLLLAIPFFMLTGIVMASGGLADRLVAFAQSLVGWMRGGMAQVDIVVSAIFADISGSAIGDAASIGGVLIPQMIRRGYPPRFAAAVQAAGGTLGLLFPPATSLIIYSSVTDVPISALFGAALVPALIATGVFMIVNAVMARRLGLTPAARFVAADVLPAFGRAVLPLFAIVIIIGGILGGVFTPTESGVVAVAYSLLVGLVATRELRWRAVPGLLVEASVSTARVTSILAGAMGIGWLLALSGIPQAASGALLRGVTDPIVGLLAINLIFLVVHTVMEAAPAIVVVTPILLPAITALHIDPIQLGVLIVINSGIGMVLPPMGILTYLTASVAEVRAGQVFRAVLPYAAALVLVLLLVLFARGLCIA
ncbi:MAG TPA: TRAP transporter large permease subunit [Acetobacteraceae bacterium]